MASTRGIRRVASRRGRLHRVVSAEERLDAGCGMGRVSIELARRGIDVVGVDLDDDLLAFARRAEPSMCWVLADLATMHLGQRFDVVAMPGNVMMFCRPPTTPRSSRQRLAISRRAVCWLPASNWRLDVMPRPRPLRRTVRCGRSSVARAWSTWDRQPYGGDAYAVSVTQRGNDHVRTDSGR